MHDLKALDTIEEKLSDIHNFSAFIAFISGNTSGAPSASEQEAFYDFMVTQGRTAKREFKKSGFPLNRESYVLFADKF